MPEVGMSTTEAFVVQSTALNRADICNPNCKAPEIAIGYFEPYFHFFLYIDKFPDDVHSHLVKSAQFRLQYTQRVRQVVC